MRARITLLLGVGAVVALAGLVRRGRDTQDETQDERASSETTADPAPLDLTLHPIRPIPPGEPLDARTVELGRRLFHDARLSVDGTVSCASCHDLDQAGTDNRAQSIGVGGQRGERNAPTVLNSGLNFRQFWDGRADTLEEQVGGPLTAPREMGSTWEAVLATLRSDASYVTAFEAIWSDGVSEVNVRRAIAVFERTLITRGARFDRFLLGEHDAITEEERRGYELFLDVGCISCHQGVNVGGNMFQRIGIASSFFADRGNVTDSDLGRYNLTGREDDVFRFKVPSLRNVSRTAPYFHDGSVPTLEQAIRIMSEYQLGQRLQDEEVRLIAAFLATLDGITQD